MRDSMRMKAAVLLVGGAVAILTACGSAKTDDKTVQNGQENSQEQGGAAGQTEAGAGDLSGAAAGENGTTLVYGSGDYTRINPAMDEHGEINILIFNGLMGIIRWFRPWRRTGPLMRIPAPTPFICRRV